MLDLMNGILAITLKKLSNYFLVISIIEEEKSVANYSNGSSGK